MSIRQFTQTTLVEAAAKTSSFNSATAETENVDGIIVYLNVSAVSGTSPTLDIDIEDSPDGTNWYTVDSFTQVTATGKQRKVVSSVGKYLRVAATLGGTTPSFTTEVIVSGKN